MTTYQKNGMDLFCSRSIGTVFFSVMVWAAFGTFQISLGQAVQFDVPSVVQCYPLDRQAVHFDRSIRTSSADQSFEKNGAGRQGEFPDRQDAISEKRNSKKPRQAKFASTATTNPKIHKTFKIPTYQLSQQTDFPNDATTREYVFTFPVSVIAKRTGSIDSVYVQIVPLSHQWQVRQITPESTISSDQVGPIAVEKKAGSQSGLNATANGSYPTIGNLNLNLQSSSNSQTVRKQQLKPKALPIITSGTSDRGAGAFFRFRPAVDFLVEGNHVLAVVFEVPINWKTDLVRVSCQAVSDKKVIKKSFLVSAFPRGDFAAQNLARKFAEADRNVQHKVVQKISKIQSGGPVSNHFAKIFKSDKGQSLHQLQGFLLSGEPRISTALWKKLPSDLQGALRHWFVARKQFLSLR